jgi:hypothetical protein
MSDTRTPADSIHARTSAPPKPFRDAVRSAALAASSRPARPWAFSLRGDTLELYADRSRAFPVVDPVGRESIIGCGAALFQLAIALHAAGHAVGVELLPEPADRDLLARVRLDAPRPATAGDRALIAALERGSTDGLANDDRAIAPHILSLLLGAARVEGAWLGFVDAPSLRRALAGLVAEASRRQGGDPRGRRERAFRAHRDDGVLGTALPEYVIGFPTWLPDLGAPVPRTAGRDPALPARALAWVERAPTVAVLTTRGDAPADWLTAGQALARVLLTARAAGVSASYLNQPIEVPELRPRVADLVRDAADPGVPGRRGGMPADATPQIVLRLGYTRAAAANIQPR